LVERDGHQWAVGTAETVALIARHTTISYTITPAIPPVYEITVPGAGASNVFSILSVACRSVIGMSAVQVVEAEEPATDPLVARLDGLLAELGAAVADCTPTCDAARIDRIARLEKLRAVTAALQAAECVRFAQSQVAEQMAAKVHPETIGRGIADQIALACKLSPFTGSRRLAVARALWFDLPDTYAQLTAGRLSERVAEIVVSETRHLDARLRRDVDTQLVAAGISEMGLRSAAACARKHAYEADPEGYTDRGRTERKHRRVSIRPAPDTMAMLSGYLPVEQGVACYAALKKHTDTLIATGDERSRDQIMADTLVEWLTGQARAEDVNVEVQIMMPIDSLTDPHNPRTATIPGAGPLPGPLARQIITSSRGRKWWQRLFTAPDQAGRGPIVGGDPFRRRFDGWLAKLITLRDQTCTDPYCDAAIRHLDHILRHRDHGPTTLTNGRGTCARGNYIREMPGWRLDLIHSGLDGRPHAICVTTPTGHTYHSRAPDPP
jgi:hypothetical protein